ncbi:hypothetical protein UAW_01850 [Enterococcus haemoperoxidus ATCC BAA-382]|uniref:Sensor histidine kinase NatK-like C-terminal domain-containing protein n=1 Tax=Enterococcus haemoperoxidus ATCC BAA-382 TaxID=1158608 RepID=R2SND1_9ENTE|nr:GHKL domain-containing protein [Enterococcus haemoperoxidus]EOH96685.1 hypothetical protein UAW_01850 [Enterococcus haemoperoxidus ATCC BAA-382]EOT60181.1 hypothetical protein I583_02816 [Enterococcus haemoperoxidus ATCC BAA-382]OJG52610.1 hypothetical protein RV06_GL000918 [Enterococcus haemoperoxidus]
MDISLLALLFTLNYLEVCWFVGYKKYFSFNQTIFLTSFIIFQVLMNYLIGGKISIYLFAPFMIIQFFFIIYSLKSWTLAALYTLLQNTIVIGSWAIPWDPAYILSTTDVISYQQLDFYRPIAIILQQILLFTFIVIAKKISIRYNIFTSISHLQKRYVLQSILCFILLVSLTAIRQIILQADFLKFRIEQYFFLTIILLSLSSIFCYIVYMISHSYQQQQQVSFLAKKLTQETEKISLANEFKHDYRNILLSLNTYLNENQIDEAKKYLSSITEYSNTFIEADYFSQISTINIPPVQGILITFSENCLKNNVPIQFLISQNISYLDITINLLDFIRCLSILLDNALEASLEVTNPLIKVTIEQRDHSIFVEVKNRTDHSISIEKILKNNFTTKKDHQGKGLHIFIKLLKQYRKTSYSFTQENNFFAAKFALPQKEE